MTSGVLGFSCLVCSVRISALNS